MFYDKINVNVKMLKMLKNVLYLCLQEIFGLFLVKSY